MKVSICILTYNHASYIRQTLDSVLGQDIDAPYEILIGDDVSTDGTRALLNEYAEQYPDRIRLFLHDTRQGPKRNAASVRSLAGGEYVAVLDGDDFWTDATKLRRQVAFLDENPDFSAVGCRYRSVFEDNAEQHGPEESPEQPTVIDLEQVLKGVWIGASTFVYRRAMVPTLPEWAGDLNCDDKILQFLCARQGPIRFFNEVWSAYRIHGGGMYSGIKFVERVGWMIDYLVAFDKELDGEYSHILHPIIADKYYLIAREHDFQQNRDESRTAVRNARRYALPIRRRIAEEGRYLARQIPFLHDGGGRLKTALRRIT